MVPSCKRGLFTRKGLERLQARTIPRLPDQPKKKRKGTKLIWLLFILFLVLLGVLFFRSSISKITDVRFIGNTLVNSSELSGVSGLRVGEPFFLISESAITSRVQERYPYIKGLRLEKHFPGQIDVYVQEYETVAFELTSDGQVMASLENGSDVTLKQEKKLVLEKPVLTQWSDKGALAIKADLCKRLANIPNGLLADISEIRYDPSDSYQDRIKMYTRSGFEVVTTVSMLPDKIAYLSGVVETQEPGRITMLNADSYISYTNLNQGQQEKSDDSE